MMRRNLTLRSALLALALGFALALATGAGAARAATATSLPADPNAAGYIGLCDQSGRNVTGGSVDTTPFVWKSVASAPPPAAYQGTGENAVLNAYQPRPGVQPADWSGTALTGASFYSTRTSPAVQATYGDLSLAQLIQEYPPQIDGLFVLRIYYGKANFGLYDAKYPSTTIQVTGTTWRVVDGGTVNCNATKAVSNEQLTGVVPKSQTVARAPSATYQTVEGDSAHRITSAPTAAIQKASGGSSPSTAAAPDSSTSATTIPTAAHDSGSSSSGWLLWGLIGVVVVLAVLLILLLRARRGPPPIAES